MPIEVGRKPEAADAHRIRALVSLAAGEPDITLVDELLGGEDFAHILGPAARDSGDLVTMAGRIKRDIEQAARGAEASGVPPSPKN